LLIEQKNYSHIPTYVFKADAALEAATATGSNGNDKGNMSAPAPVPVPAPIAPKKSAEREKVQSKLDLATAISQLGQGQYEKAANSFLNLGPPSQLGDWIGKVRSCRSSAIPFIHPFYGCGCIRLSRLGTLRSTERSVLWQASPAQRSKR
jgi:COP9 signalosome complex subunit 1